MHAGRSTAISDQQVSHARNIQDTQAAKRMMPCAGMPKPGWHAPILSRGQFIVKEYVKEQMLIGKGLKCKPGRPPHLRTLTSLAWVCTVRSHCTNWSQPTRLRTSSVSVNSMCTKHLRETACRTASSRRSLTISIMGGKSDQNALLIQTILLMAPTHLPSPLGEKKRDERCRLRKVTPCNQGDRRSHVSALHAAHAQAPTWPTLLGLVIMSGESPPQPSQPTRPARYPHPHRTWTPRHPPGPRS